ncbi:MAG: FAD-dependent oxidoreductase, partial [Betaproteobacteria bacterium]
MRSTTVAVIGAGWAGCAAAVELTRAGADVTVYEAARTAGGR